MGGWGVGGKHTRGIRSVDRYEEEPNLNGGTERRGAKFDLDSGQERWREGGSERIRQTGRERVREKDSGILVKVSSLCIACCAIPPL